MNTKTLLAGAIAVALSSGAASALTLNFDTGTSTFDASGHLIGYEQDGLVFSVTESGPRSSGANLFNVSGGLNPNGQAPSLSGGDDGDLIPAGGSADGVTGNILIRQDDHAQTGASGEVLSDDAGSTGSITFTLVSGSAFSILGFSAVDDERFTVSTGGTTLGEIVNSANNETAAVTFAAPSALIGVGGSFSVNYFGSGGVDSIVLAPVPLPAGAVLLLGALGGLGVMRRRSNRAA